MHEGANRNRVDHPGLAQDQLAVQDQRCFDSRHNGPGAQLHLAQHNNSSIHANTHTYVFVVEMHCRPIVATHSAPELACCASDFFIDTLSFAATVTPRSP